MSIPLPISSYVDIPSSTARLINCYIEQGSEQGKGPILQGSPGITSDSTLGTGTIRAMGIMRGERYTVSANKVYRGVSHVGTVTGTARPQLAGNGTELCVLIEPNAWIYDATANTFAQITDGDFTSRGASSVQFFDNYITFTEPDSGRWFSSDLAAATDYDALNFATAEGSPDDLVTHVVDHRQAFLMGVESCELWDNAGLSGFPFMRSGNGFVEIGCLVGKSAQKIDQSVIWIASDFTVRRLSGVTPVRVSTNAVERSIREWDLGSVYSFTLTWQGHLWYVLTSSTGTWVFDVTTQQWHERQSYGKKYWDISCAASLDGVTYVGSASTNRIGILDDVFSEFGDVLRMVWAYQPVYREAERAVHSSLEIVTESGVGLSTGQGSDPKISLEKSDDGGKTYRFLPDRGLGAIGEYLSRARWHRLGHSRDRVYRASISDPVRRKVVDTQLHFAGDA
jgi:hypothetical protein